MTSASFKRATVPSAFPHAAQGALALSEPPLAWGHFFDGSTEGRAVAAVMYVPGLRAGRPWAEAAYSHENCTWWSRYQARPVEAYSRLRPLNQFRSNAGSLPVAVTGNYARRLIELQGSKGGSNIGLFPRRVGRVFSIPKLIAGAVHSSGPGLFYSASVLQNSPRELSDTNHARAK